MPVVALWGIIVYVLSLTECQSFYMIVDVDVSHVGSLIPTWFAWHIVRNKFAVDCEVLKSDVLNHSALVVTGNDTHIGSRATVGYIAQRDVLDASSWGRAILLVVAHTDVEEHYTTYVVDVEVLECNVLHRNIIAVVYAYTTLIVYLIFCMFKNLDAVVQHIVNHFVLRSFAVQTYHDRVSHVSPHHKVLDSDIAATAMIFLASAIDSRAVVTGACKELKILIILTFYVLVL